MKYYAINSKHTFIISPISKIKPIVCGCTYVREIKDYIKETILKFTTYLRLNPDLTQDLEVKPRIYIGDGITVALIDLPNLDSYKIANLFEYIVNLFDLNYYYQVTPCVVNECINEVYNI